MKKHNKIRPTPPPEAFVAVLAHNITSLEEPLLSNDELVEAGFSVVTEHVPAMTTSSTSSSSLVFGKIVSFMVGAAVAAMSQFVLFHVMWYDAVLQTTTPRIIVFSLLWSILTCVMIFPAMMLWIKLMQIIFCSYRDQSAKGKHNDWVFPVEVHYVVGALTALASLWLLSGWFTTANVDLNKEVPAPRLSLLQIGAIAVAIISYLLLLRRIIFSRRSIGSIQHQQEASNDVQSYQIISAAMGLVAGMCSQFLLSSFLWETYMAKPAINNMMIFSVTWSVCTVAATLGGCIVLRAFFTNGSPETLMAQSGKGQNGGNENDVVTGLPTESQRLLLRMEAIYVSSSIMGICVAWVSMDTMAYRTEEILPSIGLLLFSQMLFIIILRLFPDDDCVLAEDEANSGVTLQMVNTESQTDN